jgi:hypothetical protein
MITSRADLAHTRIRSSALSDAPRVRAASVALATAVENEQFSGWDPYDALSSALVRRVARGRLLRQVAIQAVKALPINPRPLLAVPSQQHTKGLALFVSAYRRLAELGPDTHARTVALELAERLAQRALPMGDGVGWGYDFDVQTRWGYYKRGEPNAVVSAFAAQALLDADELSPKGGFRSLAEEALAYASEQLLVERQDGRFFAYFAGSKTPIHNANLLIASLFARCGEGASEQLGAAHDAVEYSLRCQRPDGSWPYAEGMSLRWVDGYHTAYVLRSLAWWEGRAGAPPVREALLSGLDLYLTRLIDRDGAARATLRLRYPLDIHAGASAVWMLSELADYDDRAFSTAARVLDWILDNMQRPDDRFAFQRRRLFRNSVPYIRWSDGHMLLALATYLGRAAGTGL